MWKWRAIQSIRTSTRLSIDDKNSAGSVMSGENLMSDNLRLLNTNVALRNKMDNRATLSVSIFTLRRLSSAVNSKCSRKVKTADHLLLDLFLKYNPVFVVFDVRVLQFLRGIQHLGENNPRYEQKRQGEVQIGTLKFL